ncbi:uncharacterized protein [Asterias amurensis]|uniref:uncharacterized protein n=1 Tax=Asterias amurensis TaxID=7602 RepID=UPI003AB4D4AC
MECIWIRFAFLFACLGMALVVKAAPFRDGINGVKAAPFRDGINGAPKEELSDILRLLRMSDLIDKHAAASEEAVNTDSTQAKEAGIGPGLEQPNLRVEKETGLDSDQADGLEADSGDVHSELKLLLRKQKLAELNEKEELVQNLFQSRKDVLLESIQPPINSEVAVKPDMYSEAKVKTVMTSNREVKQVMTSEGEVKPVMTSEAEVEQNLTSEKGVETIAASKADNKPVILSKAEPKQVLISKAEYKPAVTSKAEVKPVITSEAEVKQVSSLEAEVEPVVRSKIKTVSQTNEKIDTQARNTNIGFLTTSKRQTLTEHEILMQLINFMDIVNQELEKTDGKLRNKNVSSKKENYYLKVIQSSREATEEVIQSSRGSSRGSDPIE